PHQRAGHPTVRGNVAGGLLWPARRAAGRRRLRLRPRVPRDRPEPCGIVISVGTDISRDGPRLGPLRQCSWRHLAELGLPAESVSPYPTPIARFSNADSPTVPGTEAVDGGTPEPSSWRRRSALRILHSTDYGSPATSAAAPAMLSTSLPARRTRCLAGLT